MQFNVHIGAGAVLASALAAVGVWHAYSSGWLTPAKPRAGLAINERPPEFIPTNGGVLTIAWVKAYETFEKRSPSELELKVPLGTVKVPLPFGETVSEVRTAAKYQYQVRLQKRWPIQCGDTQCVVRTGPVELAEPVAIYHGETERKTRSGWARFDKAANLEQLNRSLGLALVVRGNEPRNRDVGMREGRVEIEKFVREWMAKEAHGARRIVVLYPGEQMVDGRPVPAH
ncbi:hypothetical protein [Ramlibacter algicola]|uniref:DUF4230 domain-containing protein n=1 Tax=Ramlibacter algicola TaxID=2795217 RepID=A0A934PZR4_9BURK|nr:hypothetical protein [Ramlibacter algicola]MBK0393439.1 hypothetical protein [Ramlibacter algicola]